MTVEAVEAEIKTVTRRHIDTWKNLKPGDRLTLIEKGMGLKKGEKQVVLKEVEVVDVRVESIGLVIQPGECAREGFPTWDGWQFIRFWLKGHGYGSASIGDVVHGRIECRRIEWRYLAADETGHA